MWWITLYSYEQKCKWVNQAILLCDLLILKKSRDTEMIFLTFTIFWFGDTEKLFFSRLYGQQKGYYCQFCFGCDTLCCFVCSQCWTILYKIQNALCWQNWLTVCNIMFCSIYLFCVFNARERITPCFIQLIMINTKWVLCPVCGNKIRNEIKEDMERKIFPLYCITIIKEPDA